MPSIKALLVALVVFLVTGSAAYAQPLSDVASYTNWSLANSSNPFHKDGRKGISQSEAARLPVGTLITLPDGTTHALMRGETVWQLGRAYALKKPIASATSAVEPIGSAALEQARIQARYEAEQKTTQLLTEVRNLRMAADGNLALATSAANAAFAAPNKREAYEQAAFAASAAEEARKNAIEAETVATVSERIARASGSDKALATARSVRKDASAVISTAAQAQGVAKHAVTAPTQWVTDWPPTIVLAVIVFLLVYTTATSLLFQFAPTAFNFLFRGGVTSTSMLSTPVKVLAIPAFLVAAAINRESFYEKHYEYLYGADESDSAPSADELPEDEFAAFVAEPVPEDDMTMDEERRFSPYPTDKRLELHHVVH